MKKLKTAKKVLSFITCAAISVGALAAYPIVGDNCSEAEAKTIGEIQEQRKANAEKIANLENQIASLEGDKNQEKQYQATLNEQIGYIQENITLLNAELQSIADDISATEQNIADLDEDIENQQIAIDANIELFKERLRAMYVTGNDSAASMILGSSSFYDMMSGVTMINRVAEHDDKLIEDILAEIEALEQSKSDLASEKLSLTMKLEDQKVRMEEKKEELDSLNDKMQYTQYVIDQLAMEQQALEADKAKIEQMQLELAAEEAAIEAEIQRQAEEAQRRYEEEQRKKWEAEQAALAAAAAVNGTDQNTAVQGPTYIPVAPSASGFSWPCPGYCYLSSYYGPRWGRNHNGIDVGDGNIMGGAAVASKAGTVITVNNSCGHNFAKNYSCGCGGGYGNYVVISHDGTYSTLYGHLTSAIVSVGDYVEQGQVIGYMGSTGFSTGAHLHFEVRVNGYPVDPLGYVSP